MIREFGPNIWIADGPTLRAAAGFHYPTRMAVIRLATGDLVVWSPIALSADLRSDVDALGKVRYLAPPNSLHHTFLGDWQQAYPEAEAYAPPGLREKRTDIRFANDFSDAPITTWAEEIDLAIMRGNAITTEVVFFHRPSRTAIFADLLQQFPPTWFKGWRAIVARLDLMVADEPSVPRKFRVAFTDRRAARAALQIILAWPTQKVLIAHGQPATDGGQAMLRRAFRWLDDR
jgi:hypothetical protein